MTNCLAQQDSFDGKIWTCGHPSQDQFLAATKQLYEWFSPSVCLSVCPSVCHTFFTMFPSLYHNAIFRSYYQWQKRCPCKRWRSEVKVQGHKGENPISPFPDCNYSLNSHMAMKSCLKLHVTKERYPIVFQGYPSNFKVTRLKNFRFWHPKLGISGL